MINLLSGYVMYSLSSILIFIALATLLHLQFGLTGIVNFGVVGFWGFGMYAFGVSMLKFNLPYGAALLVAAVLTGVVALVLGWVILDLDSQSILVATLAFATVIHDLITTEKWLTKGVIGLGTVPFPFDLGRYSEFGFFLIILLVTVLLFLYTYKLEASPYGRLLTSIKDNEPLARSLGKPVLRQKMIFFTITSALFGLFGAMNASIDHFLVPRMLSPGVTFTVWIALILGGRQRILGGLIGIIITIGIFDFIIETYVPLPMEYASLIPTLKYIIYGITLIIILMFRPLGILGGKKSEVNRAG
jgi:branched-chain amino acid transport system permease protein